MRKLAAIAALLLFMLALDKIPSQADTAVQARAMVLLGFLFLTSYLIGRVSMDIRLPGISGYIVGGILLGPYVLGFIDKGMAEELKFIDDLALTFIALEAGAELRLADLRAKKRSLTLLVVTQLTLVSAGVTFLLFLASPALAVFAGRPTTQVLVMCLLIGALAVARSPSTAVAIIDETRARGPFTEITLGVTVTKDLFTIIFFGMIVSLGESLVSSGQSQDVAFLLGLLGQLVVSITFGILVGIALKAYLDRSRTDLPIILLGVSFLIKKLADYLGHFLLIRFDLAFHLEPMIIAVVAGFLVRNFSRSGEEFIDGVERSSLPVFVLFFTLIGVSLNLEALRGTWMLAMIIVVIRGLTVAGASFLAGRVAGDPPLFNRMYGLAFLSQAGVSLGLVTEMMRRFPDWGETLAAPLIASIIINQLLGPIAFKYALEKVGETAEARSEQRGD